MTLTLSSVRLISHRLFVLDFHTCVPRVQGHRAEVQEPSAQSSVKPEGLAEPSTQDQRAPGLHQPRQDCRDDSRRK